MGFFKANFKTSEKGERNFNQPRILIISVLYFEKKFYKWNRYFLSLFETQIDKGLIFDNDSRWSGHKPVLYILNFFTRKNWGARSATFLFCSPFENILVIWSVFGADNSKMEFDKANFLLLAWAFISSPLSTLQEIWSLWWETTNYTK